MKAMKFVKWDVPPLESLKDSWAYQMRQYIDEGKKLDRKQKNWITAQVNHNTYFKRGIPLRGWRFDFSDVLKRYFVKQHSHICEYYACDKTSLRSILYGRVEDIIEVPVKI